MQDDQATSRYDVKAKIGEIAGTPWRIRSVTVMPDYCLSVTCNDGATGIIDMSQLIFSEKAGIYSALKDAQLFNQVRIELGVLTWSNAADFDSVWLHEGIGKDGA
ncbi:DUF2442 domain-containing protein [Nitrosomonas sp. Is24]|uniref:DUF2442 domain-containing protein n=1 Tax=Nitrosomonas sp. Is24 TaxID=3080533 RepID=UPI00294B702B|nr:DUF2442 domain-containing protein [Nitrosomonas sp. Is24]MDV6342916.1 DUF2442 domain-containing protein [Nitrosomonas sp. Is24]